MRSLALEPAPDRAPRRPARFDYRQAFCRNLGLVSEHEQELLRNTTVALAGLGAVGSAHLLTLARMGMGGFRLADYDDYELANFNRQSGATLSTIGQAKVRVMERAVLEVNPEAATKTFGRGISRANVDRFLDGASIAIDGLDFFATDARAVFYEAAYRRGIPVVAAGPLGCSAALLVFMPGGMTWQEYYAMDLARDELDKHLLFGLGNAPRATQMRYMDPSQIDLAEHKGPSLALAVQLCAGVTAAEVMKILLQRGKVYAAPYYQQFDAYRCKYVRGRLRWGNRGPLQRIKRFIFRRLLSA